MKMFFGNIAVAPVVIAVCFVSVAHGVSLQMPPVTSPAADPEVDGIDSHVFVDDSDDSGGLETIHRGCRRRKFLQQFII